MRILKEAETTEYLTRLDKAISSRTMREKLLSIDYTNYSSEKFFEFVRLFSKIGPLMQHVTTPPAPESSTTSRNQNVKTSWLS